MFLSLTSNDKKHVPWALFGLTALFGVIYWNLYSESVPALHMHYGFMWFTHFNNFSLEYSSLFTNKPQGYPVFLFLVQKLSQNNISFINTIILFQLVVFLLSAWYLAIRFYYFSNKKTLSFLALILVLGNPEIVKFCFLVMTESFMMSFLMLILGLSCQWASQKTISEQQRTILLLSACMGAAILFRPICYAWIIAAIFIFILFYGQAVFTWTERLKIIKFFLIPLLLFWILGAFFHYLTFGTFKNETELNNMMLRTAGMLSRSQNSENSSPFMQHFLSLHDPMHELLKHAKTNKMKYWVALPYTDLALTMLPDFKLAYDAKEINTQSQREFLHLLINHPIKYLKYIAMHYVALWQFWELMTPDNIQEYIQFTKTYGPLRLPEGWQFALLKPENFLEITQFSKKIEPPPFLYGWQFNVKNIDKESIHLHEKNSSLNFIPIESLTPMVTLQLKLNTYTTWPSFLFFIRTMMGLIWVITLCFFGLTLLCLLHKTQNTPPLWAGLCGASLLQATYLITASVQTGFFRYSIVMWPAVVFVGTVFLLLFLTPQKQVSTSTVS